MPRHVNPFAYQNAIRRNGHFTQNEQMLISYQGWDSFDRLLSGIGDEEDLRAMESCARVLRIVCKKKPDACAVATNAIEAAKRGLKRSKAGLDGEGINDCRTTLRLFDEALGGFTRGTLMTALKKAQQERDKEERAANSMET